MPRAARQLTTDDAPARSSRQRKLKVVTDADQPEHTGDAELTREAMSGWKEGQRRCRARKRHNWGPSTVWEYRDHYEVVEICSHCKNRRSADFQKTAYGARKVTDWQPLYREGYLLPKGAARLDEELQDELVLGDILSRRVLEAADEE